ELAPPDRGGNGDGLGLGDDVDLPVLGEGVQDFIGGLFLAGRGEDGDAGAGEDAVRRGEFRNKRDEVFGGPCLGQPVGGGADGDDGRAGGHEPFGLRLRCRVEPERGGGGRGKLQHLAQLLDLV